MAVVVGVAEAVVFIGFGATIYIYSVVFIIKRPCKSLVQSYTYSNIRFGNGPRS